MLRKPEPPDVTSAGRSDVDLETSETFLWLDSGSYLWWKHVIKKFHTTMWLAFTPAQSSPGLTPLFGDPPKERARVWSRAPTS